MTSILIKKNITLTEALNSINSAGKKCLVVIDNKNKLIGTLSDGDLRKAILRDISLNEKVTNLINTKPIYFEETKYDKKTIKDTLLKFLIDTIPIVDKNKIVKKIIHWEDFFDKNKKTSLLKNNNKIPVIIMAGGKGTRLEPFTHVLPKPLIPVNGETIIERIMENFMKQGMYQFKFLINYKSLILKAYLKELKTKFKIDFIEEKNQLGTAGGIFLLKNKIKDNFVLSNCDIIVNCDYNDLIEYHMLNKNILTIVIATKQYAVPYGNCVLKKDGTLKKIDEKPKFDFLINTGLYIINKKVLNFIKKNRSLNMDQLILTLLKRKIKVGVFPIHESQWTDIGEWSEYKKALEKL